MLLVGWRGKSWVWHVRRRRVYLTTRMCGELVDVGYRIELILDSRVLGHTY